MAPMKRPACRDLADDLDHSITLTHLAHRWRVSRREIRRLLQIGKLPFVQVLGQIRIPASAVRARESEKFVTIQPSEVEWPQ